VKLAELAQLKRAEEQVYGMSAREFAADGRKGGIMTLYCHTPGCKRRLRIHNKRGFCTVCRGTRG
jgi:hypothetical protein